MKIRNDLNLPDAVVKAVHTEPHNKPDCLSATTLLLGTKEIILTERHFHEIEVDVADRLPAFIGTAFHKLMENHTPSNLQTEIYLETRHNNGITKPSTRTGKTTAYGNPNYIRL